ncbi:class I SAM-dependent methyltransferase [Rhodococcus qingshengii]|uniref:class I SAM-dependent methyltransferase n=1 Tax=Rhodococcus qingshengii TaxID=334542 RepID=UPI0035D63A9E
MRMQEIITRELSVLGGGLVMLETGTIRSTEARYEAGDGWSTLAFARHVQASGGRFTSIDLEVAASDEVLRREGLRDAVDLRQGDSRRVLPGVLDEVRAVDVALLDSDNDADLIMEEFLLVRPFMGPGSVLLVDDVVPGSRTVVKGHRLLPYLESHGYTTEVIERDGGGFTSGVLKVIM